MPLCSQVTLQEERERNSLQLVMVVLQAVLWMETETQTGMDDHVHILTNKIGHGGESILELHSKS